MSSYEEDIMKNLVALKASKASGDTCRSKMMAEVKKLTVNFNPEEIAAKYVNMIADIIGLGVQVDVKATSKSTIAVAPKRTAMTDEDFLVLCKEGTLQEVEEALMNGANANAKDEDDSPYGGITALQEASYRGDVNIVEALLRYGAKVNAEDNFGSTALHSATNENVAEMLLRHGANINVRNQQKITALHSAAHRGDTDVIKVLLRHGADVNTKDYEGRTALHSASSNGKIDAAELLLRYDADINAEDDECCTPLYLAASKGYADVIEMLLRHGADINAKSHFNSTVLHKVSQAVKANLVVIEMLLKHGISVNAADEGGCTALHYVAELGNADVAELLLRYGADVNVRNNVRWTPLSLAKVQCRNETAKKAITKVLLAHGATE